MRIMTFGEKEVGQEYIWRPAVYGVIFKDERKKVAIIQTSDEKYFLPGGGIENNETHEECLKREAIEEMGMSIEMGHFLGCARRYFYSTKEFNHYLSEGYFYFCNIGEKIQKPIEEDHFLIWMDPSEAIENLYHEHQSWAIRQAVKQWSTKN
ncbi:NUDIX hydrolase [Alkalihalobacterium chitinilyticum]|uniref:NUDIX domain-containing protein n=1 Tax=Alkalihalobacterium chitinilyticum TaxID=2980103 RepID=A0ABT5VFY2_9BACI|nr:NUDIX domain-containing protein [Alkalihalobacterium chitinilyticum]MDE5414370.1 NUDIX domain-containing protein [Alkalihalobacterium chitinilyticum]